MTTAARITTATDHPLLDRDVPTFLEPSASSREGGSSFNNLDWRQAAGGTLLLLGAILLVLGWYGVSGTTNTAQQLSYFISGGLGGAALVASGLALLISFEHVSDRQTLGRLSEQLDALEFGLAGELDALREELRTPRAAAVATGRRSG